MRFVALSPTELARTFEDLSEHLTNMVPELQSLQKAQSPAPIVEVRESRIGYKKVYDALSALPEHDFFYVLQGQSSLQTELGLLTDEEWRTWFQKINTKHIGTRAIFTEEALSVAKSRMTAENLTRHKKRLWQLKTLPEAQLPLQQLVFIYGNNVAFLMPESELVILLEHKGTADIFRALFQGLYANARRKERPWD